MSRIDELIEQLCPDGVVYKPIKKVYRRLKGTPITAGKMKEIADPNGEIKIFAGGQTMIFAHEKDIPKANITRVPAVLVQSRGIIDFVYYDQPFTFKNEMWAYTADDNTSVKFLYHVLKANTEAFRNAASGMGSMPQISLKVTENFKVPVPPIEVQREIVRILDAFMELETNLEAELEARHRQFDFYIDLLASSSDYPTKTISQLCDVFTGGEPPSDCIKGNVPDDSHPYAVWANGRDVYGYAADYRINKDAVCISSIGANTGAIFFHEANFTPIIRLKVLVPKSDEVLTRFLYYVMLTVKFGRKSGSVPNINANDVKRIEVPIPPLSIQRDVIAKLDQFDALVNSLNDGIPAEVEARHRQYTYYRDRLLSFKKKVI